MHSNTESTLLAIILGCCQNRRNSQRDLYKLYYAYGMSIAIRYVENEEDALTIFNDAFLKVFNNIKKFDTNQPFKPWFRKILVNVAINFVKSTRRYKMEVNLESAKNIPDNNDILSKLNYKDLIDILQQLSISYRTVFNLYVIDGFKHKEIAEMLGITVSTSKSNLVRARQRLKELITQKLEREYV